MPIKNDEGIYKQIIKARRINDYTTGNLLDYEYFSKHYRLIPTDLSKQIEVENPDLKQQINFIERLEKNEGATMFVIIEKSEETIFKFSQNSARVFYYIYNNGNTKNCKFFRWFWQWIFKICNKKMVCYQWSK